MLLQIKIYLTAILYFFGALFMVLFPPRNYELSGAKIRIARSTSAKTIYDRYVDYKTMLEEVQRIAKSDSEVVQVIRLTPNTVENRSIIALELRSDEKSKKPGILIVGALNAMAWAAPNAILELAEKLIYDPNYQTPFFNDYDWYLIPMANPDGMEFTKRVRNRLPLDAEQWSRNLSVQAHSRPSMWHKNVDKDSSEPSGACFGTNVNRNFAYHWQDDVRKTPERCSQLYPGEKPFSTPEAQAIRHYLNRIGDEIQLAIHLHASFVPKKEFILYPWRYSLRQPSNHATLQAIGEYAARQARLPDGRIYEVHQSSNDERVAGTISDYISGVVGIDLVYLLKPYYQPFPNYSDTSILDQYTKKSIQAILSVVRGWRSSTKLNTLYFFGTEVEF